MFLFHVKDKVGERKRERLLSVLTLYNGQLLFITDVYWALYLH